MPFQCSKVSRLIFEMVAATLRLLPRSEWKLIWRYSVPCSWLDILGKRYVHYAEYSIGFKNSPLTNSTFYSPSPTYLIPPSIIALQQLSTIYRTMDITICVGHWNDSSKPRLELRLKLEENYRPTTPRWKRGSRMPNKRSRTIVCYTCFWLGALFLEIQLAAKGAEILLAW